VKALRHHGDGSLDEGAANLARHIELVRRLGWAPVVAVNAYEDDRLADLSRVRELALAAGARDAEIADGFRLGGEGMLALANAVRRAATRPQAPHALYSPNAPLEEKLAGITPAPAGWSRCAATC
jgi:formate--tetrahydrofolate ligase